MKNATQITKVVIALGLTLANAAFAGSKDKALTIFRNLNGVPMRLTDVRLNQMVALIDQGKLAEAAAIASHDDHFYNVTLKHWATIMSNREETPNAPLNDFVTFVIGHTRDGYDARTLLTMDAAYIAPGFAGAPQIWVQNNKYFEYLESKHANYRTVLQKVSPQYSIYQACASTNTNCPIDPPPPHLGFIHGSPGMMEYPGAGLLTTRAWAVAHLAGGTGRRAIEFSFREFMCKPMKSVADRNVTANYVRKDVDRLPGGNSQTFNNLCISCHGIMDALAGAFSNFDAMTFRSNTAPFALRYRHEYGGDFANNPAGFENGVAVRNNRNDFVYPDGHGTDDDSWVNFAIQYQNASFGWRGPSSGNGVQSLGNMFADSRGFSECMAMRVYKYVCMKSDFNPENMSQTDMSQLSKNGSTIQNLADKFESTAGNFRLQYLFEQAAILPQCMGE